MRRMSHRELINDSFLRGVLKAAKTAAETLTPELTQPIKALAQPFQSMKQAYSSEQPLSVLKDFLSNSPDIELIEVLKQETKVREANPNKNRLNRALQPKNVTLITFRATVYKKGVIRDYKTYGEAITPTVSNMARSLPRIPFPKKRLPGQPPVTGRPPKKTKRPDIDEIDTTPNKEEAVEGDKSVKTLTAEIFRTAKGLILDEIYDTETGYVYYKDSGKQKQLPSFDNTLIKYKDPQTGGYPVRRLIAFLDRDIGIKNTSAKNIVPGATDLQDLISKLTGIAPINLDTIIPEPEIQKIKAALLNIYVEQRQIKGKSQRQLLYEVVNLVKTTS